jgi:uncharacterized membrane protein
MQQAGSKPALLTVAAVTFAVGVCDARAATPYSVTRLGQPPGTYLAAASGINAAGQVTGRAFPDTSTAERTFLWTPDGSGSGTFAAPPQIVGMPGRHLGYAINDAGQVAAGGWLNPAFIWNTSNNSVTLLPDINPAGSEGVHAVAINGRGAVVGYGWDFFGGGGNRAFLWQPNTPNGSTGTMVPLGGGGGQANSTGAVGINDAGSVIGFRPDGYFLWKPSAPNATTGTFFPDVVPDAILRDIDNAGRIVGHDTLTERAILWTPDTPNGTNGTVTDLGTAPGAANYSIAEAMNDGGVIVGTIHQGAAGRAFVWTAADGMLDLNTLLDASGLGWSLISASAVNDNGRIVAYGRYDPDGPTGVPAVFGTVVLTPIPEPATGAAVLCGTFSAVVLGRKRKRS